MKTLGMIAAAALWIALALSFGIPGADTCGHKCEQAKLWYRDNVHKLPTRK